MEGRALVTEALLASAESTEVLGGLGNNIVEEVEVDAALLSYWQTFVSFDSRKNYSQMKASNRKVVWQKQAKSRAVEREHLRACAKRAQ